MVWSLTRVVIHSDDENSEVFGAGAAFSLAEEREIVSARPFDDTELDDFDRALNWFDTNDVL